jgi:phenylpyruvate tautomerase PptA (4-oxalocrotonate tautomerase family)
VVGVWDLVGVLGNDDDLVLVYVGMVQRYDWGWGVVSVVSEMEACRGR